MRLAVVSLSLILLSACTTMGDPAPAASVTESDLGDGDLLSFMTQGRPKGAAFDALVAQAARHPLGSKENPIRVNMPEGQRAYPSRLRCSDGRAPSFHRIGNFGVGPFYSIIDGYEVVCAGSAPAERTLFMDMYHPTHHETAAPEGYTLAPSRGAGGGPYAALMSPAA